MTRNNKAKPTSKSKEIIKNQDRPASEFSAKKQESIRNGASRYGFLTNFALMFLFPLVAIWVGITFQTRDTSPANRPKRYIWISKLHTRIIRLQFCDFFSNPSVFCTKPMNWNTNPPWYLKFSQTTIEEKEKMPKKKRIATLYWVYSPTAKQINKNLLSSFRLRLADCNLGIPEETNKY